MGSVQTLARIKGKIEEEAREFVKYEFIILLTIPEEYVKKITKQEREDLE